jgi:phenylacetic acid degradation operon negative regulatory protein
MRDQGEAADLAIDVEQQTQWVLVTFSIPEAQRGMRHLLRTLLERAGLARFGNGVWIGPEVVAPNVHRLVEAAGLSPYVDYFLATYGGFQEDNAALAGRCWDLGAARRELEAFETAARAQLAASRVTDEQAFVAAMTLNNAWRRLQSTIPALPSRLLLPGASRPAAEHALKQLLEARLPAAHNWVTSLRC